MLSSIKMFKSQTLDKMHYLHLVFPHHITSWISSWTSFKTEFARLPDAHPDAHLSRVQGQPGYIYIHTYIYIIYISLFPTKKIKFNQNENLWKEKGIQQDFPTRPILKCLIVSEPLSCWNLPKARIHF